MDRRFLIIGALLTLFSFRGFAQGTKEDLQTEAGARVSVTLDKKLVKGLHITADAEGRLSENMKDFGRYQFGAGISYKALDFLKIGAGYTYISKKNSSDIWKPRHRVYGDVMLSYKTGGWRFSLKERLQLTHRDIGNPYQKVPNVVELKSRLKAAYKFSNRFEPYAYVELRTRMNDPACTATWNESTSSYSDYSFKGYTDTYFNRLRGAIGAEYKLSTNHALDFFFLTDYCYEKNVDTNAEGTKLKSLTYERDLNFSLGIGYTFSF